MISNFLGTGGNVPTNNGSSESVGVEDNLSNLPGARKHRRQLGNLLGGLFGGGAAGRGGDKSDGPPEARVAASAGDGASSGLPTASDDGEVTLTYRQVCRPHSRYSYPLTPAGQPRWRWPHDR